MSEQLTESLINAPNLISYLKANRNEAVIKALITTDALRYSFCKEVEDRKELWSAITSDEWRYYYCKDVKDRPEVSGEIGSDPWLFFYFRDCQILTKDVLEMPMKTLVRLFQDFGYNRQLFYEAQIKARAKAG